MHRVCFFLFLSMVAVSPAAAQNGRLIFDTIIDAVGAELKRQQQRENQRQLYEQQRRAEQHRLQIILANHWERCFGGDLFACDEALHSPLIEEQSRQRLRAQRQTIVVAAEQQRELAQQIQRERAERERAAELERQRQQRDARERSELERRASQERERQAQASEIARQPPIYAVQHTSSIPAQLAAARPTSQAFAATPIPPTGYIIAILVLTSALMATLASLFRERLIAELGTIRQMFSVSAADTTAPSPPPSPRRPGSAELDETSAAQADPAPDAITAAQALRLAHAYLDEVRQSIARDLDNPARLADHRTTLGLAVRQLDIAARADGSAKLELSDDDDTFVLSQAYLRASALTQEARTFLIEKPSKATHLLEQATTLDPEHLTALTLLGQLYFDRRDKLRAIAALERALTLAPDDLDIIKTLDRARNMTGSERAAHAATRAVTGTIDAAVATGRAIQMFALLVLVGLAIGFVVCLISGNYAGAVAIWIVLSILGLCRKGLDAARTRVRTWIAAQ